MIIKDLSHVEIVPEEAKEVQGGFQYSPSQANAGAFAFASGSDFARTITITYTDARSYSNRISYSS
ncbi:MAG: hypothetical protein HC862_01925 [Scytonema sp. RU_4_4]|nr:hypothetical protein [Scytonema sp. RU_4_4]NJR76892.1 hypothetical protein [Scytonema sp. CRU_2_7]